MADISQEIAAFQNAVYGEEVRGSMISAIEKINDVAEDAVDTVDTFSDGFSAATTAANNAAAAANTAASTADTATSNANTATSAANAAATNATTAAANADSATSSANTAEAARVTAEQARVTAERSRASAETARATAETARANAESNRASNESTRQENETGRNSAEVSRVTAEANRAAAETQRSSNESTRQSNESNRATTFRQMQDAFAEMEQQVIPPATTSTLGGVIVGEGLDVASDGTLSFEAGNFETTDHAAATYATITDMNGKANASHTHAATDIASGTLPVARGGTGVTTAAAERERLGLGSSTGALPVANGGTGATTAADARTNLEVYSDAETDTLLAGKAAASHTHAAADIASGQLAIANGGTGASTAAGAKANIVDGQALAPASVAATGAISGSSVSDSVGTMAQLRESISLTNITNVTDFLTPSSDVTADGSLTVFGKVAFMYLRFRTSSAQSAKWQAATVKPDYRPADYVYSVEWNTGAAFELGTDGRLRLNSAVNAATYSYVSFTYLLG